jgi:mono/diheme cytochrome c family protein
MSAEKSLAAVILFLFSVAICQAREWRDATGQFKVEAELVAVRDGKVYLEKTDGNVVSVPLEKLSRADRDYLKSLDSPAPKSSSPTPAAATPTRSAPVPADKQALAQKAQAVFRANCYRCHGAEGANEGGLNYILNLEKLAQSHVKPGVPSASPLYERLASTSEDTVMPPAGEKPRPSPEDIALVKQWIEAGAPAAAAAAPRDFVSNQEILKTVAYDLQRAPERSRRYLRYFTLTHLYNVGVSEDELQTYRLAFAKLINSLSWNSTIVKPETIDVNRTIFRIDIRQLNWTQQTWDDIARSNPYGIKYATPEAKTCYDETKCDMPLVRVDWFVFAAARPPLYHAILGIPETDRELQQTLRVEVAANIDQEKVVRAAFNRSGVSQNNRLIERHALPFGGYWKSYDFGGNVGRQNLFQCPLGPGDSAEQFRHDGGEIIFSLPNGMQGYMLVDRAGNRIDKGPTEIVSDPKRPDKAVTNGVSCMSCHYSGTINKADEVRPFVEANRKSFKDPDAVLALYPAQSKLDEYYEEDRKRFLEALRQIGIWTVSRTGEPISTMAQRFEEELDLPLAAAELGLTAADFAAKLDQSQSAARVLGTLRIPGGTVKRDVFVELFGRVSFELGLVTDASGLPTRGLPSVRISGVAEDFVGEVRRFKAGIWGTQSLAFSPDGAWLAVGKMDETLLVVDVNSTKTLSTQEKLRDHQMVSAVAFTTDGTKLLSAGYSGLIQVWNVGRDGTLSRASQFSGPRGEVKFLVVSNDSRLVLTGGNDRKLHLWRMDDGKELQAIEGFERDVAAAWLAPSGRLGIGTDGRETHVFDVETGKSKSRHKLATGSGQAAAISPDGTRLAISTFEGIVLSDARTGKESRRLEQRGSLLRGLLFSPDGRYLASGDNGVAHVWDARTGKKVQTLRVADHSSVQVLAFSPDNRHLAACTTNAGAEIAVFRLPKAEDN